MTKHLSSRSLAQLGSLILGNGLLAFAVAAFVSPSGIIMGGSTGIGLALTHFFPVLSLSITVFAVNLLLFLIGTVCLGKAFAAKTVISTFLYPAFLDLFLKIPGVATLTDDLLISTVFGGLLLGTGIALVLRSGASSGGTDVLALVFNKVTHVPVATLLYVIDFAVLVLQVSFSDRNQVLYGILFLILQTLTLNKIIVSGKTQIQLLIMSGHTEAIREQLLHQEDVGVTLFRTESGFTQTESNAILCITSRRKLHSVLDMINETDPDAFITIHEVNEVRGHGFTSERIKL